MHEGGAEPKGALPVSGGMLGYAITFLLVAIVAAILGFGVVAGTAALIAKICFVVFLVLFFVSLVSGRRPPV